MRKYGREECPDLERLELEPEDMKRYQKIIQSNKAGSISKDW